MSENKSLVIKTNDEIVLATLECARMEDEHARAVQTEVIAAAAQAPNLPIVLDMSKVEMLPSLSIGALVTLLQKFKQDGQRFMLVGLRPKARETLTVCRLDKLFEICDSLEEALSRIRQSS